MTVGSEVKEAAPFVELVLARFKRFGKEKAIKMRVIGKTSMLYGALSAACEFGIRVSGSIRNKDDFVNDGVGGALAGALIGVYKRNLLVATNMTLAMGIGMVAGVYLYVVYLYSVAYE